MRMATLLYGERFNAQSDTLAIAMVNVNPVSHVPLALANLTRIEQGEAWTQYDHMTGAVAKMIVAVDHERLAVAAAFGLTVRSIEEHFHYSFGVPMADFGTQSLAVHTGVGSPAGPVSLESRYFTEDVPYGLAFYAAMGRTVGVRHPATTRASRSPRPPVGAASPRRTRSSAPSGSTVSARRSCWRWRAMASDHRPRSCRRAAWIWSGTTSTSSPATSSIDTAAAPDRSG